MAAAVAESSLSTEISENLLMCPICHSAFAKPKVLACQHSFCSKCLKGWLQTRSKKTNNVKCAVCRKVTVLPKHGVDDLPENYAIKGLLSMLKHREKNVGKKPVTEKPTTSKRGSAKPSPKTTAKAKTKTAAIKNVPPKSGKEVAKQVAEMMKSKTNAQSKKNDNKPTKQTGKAKSPAASSRKQDKNANVKRTGKKGIVEKEESSSEEESGSDDYSSSEDDSDASGSSDGVYDDELTPDDSCSSGDEDDSESDDEEVPATPTIKAYGEIKVGMEVYVFNRRGKEFPGVVKLLESCNLKPPTQPRTYAGVELMKENMSLLTDDIDDLDNPYLAYWIEEYEKPCTVVRADDCIPVSLVHQLMGS